MNILILMYTILLYIFSEFISANDIPAGNFPFEEGKDGVDERILGGLLAKQGQFPWMVAINYQNSSYVENCTGFVADKKTIITAAHCIHKGKGKYTAYVGSISVKQSRKVAIRFATAHPQFDPETFKYDVAILVPEQDISFDDNVKPICLEGWTTSHINSRVTAMGFGLTTDCSKSKQSSRTSDILMYHDKKVIKEDENNIYIEGLGTSTCKGDSGGPLVSQAAGTPVAIGVLSTSQLGHGRDRFIRISTNQDFIKKFAKEASFC